MQANDLPTMVSMVDAIFDRGYYREILVVTTDGKVLIERRQEVVIDGVPSWFVKMNKLELPRAEALVMSGWNQAANVYVSSHPGYAYHKLWRSSVQMLVSFLMSATIVIIIGAFLLRALLKPLKAVERQADALCARRYEIQEKLPKTREMRSVVTAMNRMTKMVKKMFEEQARSAARLKYQAYHDSVTNLENRYYFDIQLQARLKSPEEFITGALLLVELHDLHGLNERRGFEAGDELLKAAADVLRSASGNVRNVLLARIGGADFALVLQETYPEEAEKLAARIAEDLSLLHRSGLTESEHVANVGVAMYVDGVEYSEFLAQADMALRAAQSKGPNQWSCCATSESTAIYGRHEWKSLIEEVLQTQRIVLYQQSVLDINQPEKVLHREVFVRVLDHNSQLQPAALFMPMAEEIGVARELDWLVINQVVEKVANSTSTVPFAVNLSPSSLQDAAFLDKVIGRLEQVPHLSSKLVFEFADCGVAQEPEGFRYFATALQRLGFSIGMDHFGRGFCSFTQLQTLRPSYVKIDGAYTANVAEDRDNQFFVETLGSVAHSLGILAIAEAVEKQEQWDSLRELHVDGVQGFAVARPEPMDGMA
jgi:diguanylate cyclase (GGDEF)-like protein